MNYKHVSSVREMVEYNPLHPNISMLILHNTLYFFPEVLTRRICSTIKSFFSFFFIFFILVTLICDSGEPL